MRFTKDQVRKKYMQIYQLKAVQRLSNAQITAIIPNCKERTIQKAMRYIDEVTYTNSTLIQMAIDGYNDDISGLYELLDGLVQDFRTIDATDTSRQTKRNSTARIINEIRGQIADIRTKIVRLQGLFEKEVHKEKSIFDYPKVEFTTQTVIMVKNADGSYKTFPAADELLKLAEERSTEEVLAFAEKNMKSSD